MHFLCGSDTFWTLYGSKLWINLLQLIRTSNSKELKRGNKQAMGNSIENPNRRREMSWTLMLTHLINKR